MGEPFCGLTHPLVCITNHVGTLFTLSLKEDTSLSSEHHTKGAAGKLLPHTGQAGNTACLHHFFEQKY